MLMPLFASFVILLVVGCPIAITLGVSSVLALIAGAGFDLTITMQRMFNAVNSFPLMAIPFFMLAGTLMEQGGISKRIIKFADAFLGHITGGLAVVAVVSCMIFAAISGSAVATVAAIGALMVPEMVTRGYSRGLATATVTAAGTTGPIIPPSTLFVLYASIAGVSVTDMFMAGYIPGLLMGLVLICIVVFKAKRLDIPKREKLSFRQRMLAIKEAIAALLAPVIIIVGIMSGKFTPTEAGAIGCVYALIVGKFVYRDLNFKNIFQALKDSALSSSIIMYLIGTASVFSWILTVERVPQLIQTFFMGITQNKYVLLLLITLLLFVVGMLLDSSPAISMLAPVLVPLVKAYGIDPVHFGIVMSVNLCIGLLTPPVGTCLFVGCRISNLKINTLVKEIWPMIVGLIIVLLICTFSEGLVMLIPRLLR